MFLDNVISPLHKAYRPDAGEGGRGLSVRELVYVQMSFAVKLRDVTLLKARYPCIKQGSPKADLLLADLLLNYRP